MGDLKCSHLLGTLSNILLIMEAGSYVVMNG